MANHYTVNTRPDRSVLQAFATRRALREFLDGDHPHCPVEIGEDEARAEAFASGVVWLRDGATIPEAWQRSPRRWETYGPVPEIGDDVVLAVLRG